MGLPKSEHEINFKEGHTVTVGGDPNFNRYFGKSAQVLKIHWITADVQILDGEKERMNFGLHVLEKPAPEA